MNGQLQKEKEAEVQARQASRSSEQASSGSGGGSKGWNEEELQLLIKAVNLFPAGTNARYPRPSVAHDHLSLKSTQPTPPLKRLLSVIIMMVYIVNRWRRDVKYLCFEFTLTRNKMPVPLS